MSESVQQPTYSEMLDPLRESENDAIALYLKVIPFAPPEDIPVLVEIVNDENDHLRRISEILMRYQQTGSDDK